MKRLKDARVAVLRGLLAAMRVLYVAAIIALVLLNIDMVVRSIIREAAAMLH